MKEALVKVQVKAVKPCRVVTIATFASLDLARECRTGLEALGFEAILSYKVKPDGN